MRVFFRKSSSIPVRRSSWNVGRMGVSRDTVYTWVNEKGNLSAVAKHGRGRMPAHKVGKLWKFKLAHVDKWVESGKAAGKTEK